MTSVCSTADAVMVICKQPVDWSATGDFWSGMAAMLGVAVVLGTAVKAANALRDWKVQRITERKMDQAERILTATYEAKDGLDYVRHMMTWANELDAAREIVDKLPRWGASTANEKKRLEQAQAKLTRLANVRDNKNKLVECMPMAKALFGDDLHGAITTLHHQFWVVETYVQAYVDDERGGDAEFTAKIRDAMFGATSADNEVSRATAESIAKIEAQCLPILRLEMKKQGLMAKLKHLSSGH